MSRSLLGKRVLRVADLSQILLSNSESTTGLHTVTPPTELLVRNDGRALPDRIRELKPHEIRGRAEGRIRGDLRRGVGRGKRRLHFHSPF